VTSVSFGKIRAAWIEVIVGPTSSDELGVDVDEASVEELATVLVVVLLAGVELASELDGVVTPQAARTNITNGNSVIFFM
jgi:hypothetical protein